MNAADFRQAMSQYPTGVAVVAMADPDGVEAMTVGSFTSLSLDPPLVVICVGRQARMAPRLVPEAALSINVLREDQGALSTYFAGSWKDPAPPPHRFVPWNEVPRLEGVIVTLAARVTALADGGDHLVVIAEVGGVHLGVAPRNPLLFFDRRYQRLDTGPGEAAPELDPAEAARLFHEPQ